MVCRELKRITKEKIVNNADTSVKEKLQFLRMRYINDYKNSTSDAYVAYKLSNSYRSDHWLRQRKWRWSILFWEIGVMLVN